MYMYVCDVCMYVCLYVNMTGNNNRKTLGCQRSRVKKKKKGVFISCIVSIFVLFFSSTSGDGFVSALFQKGH